MRKVIEGVRDDLIRELSQMPSVGILNEIRLIAVLHDCLEEVKALRATSGQSIARKSRKDDSEAEETPLE